MASYKISQKARADLKRIWLYGVYTYGVNRADQYHEGLLNRFSLIAEQPFMFQSVDEIRAGYRRSVFGHDSIYYRIQDDVVEIMTVLGRQDADEWL